MRRRTGDPLVAIGVLRERLARFERLARRVTRGLRVRAVNGDVRGEWLLHDDGVPGAAILYVHGGAFVAGSPLTHRRLTTALAKASGLAVFALRYRLAPEYRFPAALEDVVRAFDHLVASGIAHDRIVLAGDSAGGGLVLSAGLALATRRAGAPGGIVAFSPWTDLAVTGASVVENAERDDMLAAGGASHSARHYAYRDVDLTDPLASALYGDLGGFPHALVFASESEILRDDAVRFVERARAAGSPVDLVLARDMPHVWPVFCDVMPEARVALDRAAAYARRRVAASVSSPVPPLPA